MAKLGRLGTSPDREIRVLAARKWKELYGIVAGESALDPFADVVDGGQVDDIAEMRLTAVKPIFDSAVY
jgi:hypothetical protein